MHHALFHFASVVVAVYGEADEADELLQHSPLRKRTWQTDQDAHVGADQDGGHVVLEQEVHREFQSVTKARDPVQSVDCGFERFESTNGTQNLMDFGLLVKGHAIVQGHKVGGNIWAGGNVTAKYRKKTDQTIDWGKNGRTIWYGQDFLYNKEKAGTDHDQKALDLTLWSSIEDFVTGRTFDESCRVFDFDEDGGKLDEGASENPFYRVLVVNQDTHFTAVPQKPEWGHANHKAGDSSKFFTMTTKCQNDPDIYFRSNEYAEKGENTLVIFTGSDTVVLGKATEFYDGTRWHNGGFKWGATVIAPFAKVICWADNTGGPCNGAIVARGLDAGTDGQNVRGQYLGGQWYTGSCPDVASTPPPAALPSKPEPVCLQCSEPRKGQPSVTQLSKPYCHAVVSSGTCAFSAATVNGPVYCGGDLEIVGHFDKVFKEIVYVNNPSQPFPRTNLNENENLASNNDVSKTFPDFAKGRDKYSDVLESIRNNPQTLQDHGWRPFGTTGMSFWKRNPNWIKNADKEPRRLVVHIVNKEGTFSTNYKQVLVDSGLAHQVDVDDSKTYRWCETEWQKNNQCKKNGAGEIYIDATSGSNTLVVFTKATEVSLTKTPGDHRKWGPTVFAPDTNIKVETQDVYGQLIVKNLLANEGRTGDHLWGNCFTEPLCLG